MNRAPLRSALSPRRAGAPNPAPSGSGRPRTLAFAAVLLAAVAAAFPAPPAGAQEPAAPDPIQIDVDSALGDSCEAGWLPVRIRVLNQSEAELRGRVVARYLLYGKELRGEAHSAEVFPRQSRRDLHYLLFVPPLSHDEGEIEAAFEPEGRGAVRRARLALKRVMARRHLSISRVPGLMADLPLRLEEAGPEGFGGSRARFLARDARIDALPDHWLGYERFHLVLLHDFNVGELSEAQRTALIEWVRSGGNLLVSPGPDPLWLENELLKRLVALPVVQPRVVQGLPELERSFGPLHAREPFPFYPFSGGTPRKGGSEDSWLREYRAGLGSVWMLGFDLGRPPFTGWKDRPDFWREVASLIPEPASRDTWTADNVETYYGPASQQQLDPRVEMMARGMSRMPSMILLFGLILVYVVVVGPVNYLVLRRLNLHIYTVITVPLIAGGFVGLIVAIGYATRGVTTLVQAGTLAVAGPDSPNAMILSYGCVYAASARGYSIEFGDGMIPLPIYASRADAAAQVLRIQQGSATRIDDFHLKLWDTGVFQGRGWHDLGGPVRAVLRDGGVTLENRSDSAFADAVVLGHGWSLRSTGFEAAPGATVAVALTAARQTTAKELVTMLELPEEEFPIAWLDYAVERIRGLARSGLFVLVRLKQDPIDLKINGQKPSFRHRVPLLVVEVEGPP